VLKTTLTALFHGMPGVGKSWLADSAPGPRLVLDTEGRAKYTPSGPKIGWDPMTQAPPAHDGTWDTCVVSCHSTTVLNRAYDWLRSGQHPFVSVVLDSVMELQKRTIEEVAGLNQLTQQDWGTLLRRMEAEVRRFRDLSMYEDNPVQVVIFTCGSGDATGKYEPLLQGQLRGTLPYYFDVVGYLYVAPTEDGQQARHLLVHPHQGFVAKDGTGKLPGPVMLNPRVDSMVELMRPAAPATLAPVAEGGTV
jgi:hypothetical protein